MKRELKGGTMDCPKNIPVNEKAGCDDCPKCKETYSKSSWREQVAHLYATEWLLYQFYFRPAEGSGV